MINVLLQTTIGDNADDWDIRRFSHLEEFLRNSRDDQGHQLFNVVARNRGPADRPDPVLSSLPQSGFDELWLFGVDTGDGLQPEDSEGIAAFRRRGGGVLVTRDHMDVGSSLIALGQGLGSANHFHTRNADPDSSRHCPDDLDTDYILWPNYHSGANGDYQRVEPLGAVHPVLRDPLSPQGHINYLPAHPHEGSVGVPADEPTARAILRGRSAVSGREFDLVIAFERTATSGPAIAQSTFHHFCDYNWDIGAGAPSFVDEPPSDAMRRFPDALRSTKQYTRNVALWLAGRPPS